MPRSYLAGEVEILLLVLLIWIRCTDGRKENIERHSYQEIVGDVRTGTGQHI